MSSPERVPVVIAGAGFAGLSTAMFLGTHGVPALVVERHPGLAEEIKARGVFPHAMEALRIGGVADRVHAAAGWRSAGDLAVVVADRLAGPVLRTVVAAADMPEITPERLSLASQGQVEPILADRAVELGAEIRFGTEVVRYEQDDDGVTVCLRQSGVEYQVRADYLVAADGWRSGIRDQSGIALRGRGVLGHMLRIFFEADLTAELAHLDGVAEGRRFALVHLVSAGNRGTFYTTGTPGRYGYFRSLTRHPGDYTGCDFAEMVRTGLELPDLEVAVVDVGETAFACDVAETFTAGRVLLVGDAAKVVPPTGGLGGTTAIMDGFYLAWKLAAVVTGQAGTSLLATHDAERRPVAEMIAEQQFAALVTRAEPGLADGTSVVPLDPATQAFGYRYATGGAVVREPGDDGALIEDPLAPTGRPGSRAPYVRLADGTSTTALFGKGFVLLCDSDSGSDHSWERAAAEVAERVGVGIAVHVIDDPEWHKKYGVGTGGAVLVRPDRFVAWRSTGSDSAADLEHAMRVVLHRTA
ncbi:hypothetical protein ALI144C_37785 [Actinosynnema sp. ALI-1.44]|uniref:FAD-dependent monooxygenase n=1 Tax=Actinosynnema sp. ALI-1.44 TaxID=1933779 RepID=UPI00097C37FD|nr:FAD-dependent monooxygenase [Actinosynnema sp. ALI-1.44]ONI76394.1 hypothetical protein ALI144C_37785 [Actinosynnema sp. ALI-1.44]